jgi:hypothetical protein
MRIDQRTATKGKRQMTSQTIQDELQDTGMVYAILQRQRALAGQLVIDQGRIQQLGPDATDAQKGWWERVRECHVPLTKAIAALEEAHSHLFKVAAGLRGGEMEGQGVGDAPDLEHSGRPQPIEGQGAEGDEWKKA